MIIAIDLLKSKFYSFNHSRPNDFSILFTGFPFRHTFKNSYCFFCKTWSTIYLANWIQIGNASIRFNNKTYPNSSLNLIFLFAFWIFDILSQIISNRIITSRKFRVDIDNWRKRKSILAEA